MDVGLLGFMGLGFRLNLAFCYQGLVKLDLYGPGYGPGRELFLIGLKKSPRLKQVFYKLLRGLESQGKVDVLLVFKDLGPVR